MPWRNLIPLSTLSVDDLPVFECFHCGWKGSKSEVGRKAFLDRFPEKY
jgi:hypothetical protein